MNEETANDKSKHKTDESGRGCELAACGVYRGGDAGADRVCGQGDRFFCPFLPHSSVLTSRGQHRDSPVARIVEVKRLLSSLLPPEAADHEEGEQRLEEPVDGGDKGDAEEKEKESASGSERKPKKKQKRSKKDD